jgi:delta8-fatty-acid desaturase
MYTKVRKYFKPTTSHPVRTYPMSTRARTLPFVFEGNAYDAGEFAYTRHPGGPLLLEHVAGTDATAAIRANHPAAVWERLLPAFRVSGTKLPAPPPSPSPSPSPPPSPQWDAVYAELAGRVEGAGLLDPLAFRPLVANAWALLRCGALWALFRHCCSDSALGAGLLLAAFWQQAALLAHDAGHNALTHRRGMDRAVGTVLASALGGLSLGWWKDSHHVHHLVTNEPAHDPDIQHAPFLAVSGRLVDGTLTSSYYPGRVLEAGGAPGRFLLSVQHHTYYLICALGRLGLYTLSYRHLARCCLALAGSKSSPPSNFRPASAADRGWLAAELAGIGLFWWWYASAVFSLGPAFVAASHLGCVVLHLQITLSHFGMPTEAPPKDSFLARGLRTTTDVEWPACLDWMYGGLQFQVAHHLFPRLPRSNLRAATALLVDTLRRHGLEGSYSRLPLRRVLAQVVGVLRNVADQLAIYPAGGPIDRSSGPGTQI